MHYYICQMQMICKCPIFAQVIDCIMTKEQ